MVENEENWVIFVSGIDMKGIVCAGIILILAGCGVSATMDRTADPTLEGWYNQEKTEQERLQDLHECQTGCLTA